MSTNRPFPDTQWWGPLLLIIIGPMLMALGLREVLHELSLAEDRSELAIYVDILEGR